MSDTKEINFFFHESLFAKGIHFYETFFKDIPSDKRAYGEASPGYICHPEAPIRIKNHLPNAKLILTVRNPIKRAYSQYWDNRTGLSETKMFEETIDLHMDDSYVPGKIGYFSRGVYVKHIRSYLRYFNPEQMIVMLFEDLLQDPFEFYRKIFQFLNVSPQFEIDDMSRPYNPASIWINPFYSFFFTKPLYQKYLHRKLRRFLFWGERVSYKYPDMSGQARKTLNEFYKPWNKELSEYLGRDLSIWKN